MILLRLHTFNPVPNVLQSVPAAVALTYDNFFFNFSVLSPEYRGTKNLSCSIIQSYNSGFINVFFAMRDIDIQKIEPF